MANSMLDAITQFVTPSLTSQIGALEGESQSAVTKGFAAAIPAVLGLVTSRATDEGFVSQLFALARDPNSSAFLDDPNRLMDQVTSSVRNGGPVDRFSSMVIGGNRDRLVDAIARFAGVQSSAASSILAATTPMVLGFLGRLVRHDGLDAATLGQRLAEEHQSVLSAVPAGLSSIMSSGTRVASSARETVEQVAASAVSPSSWAWVAAALALTMAVGAYAVSSRHRMMQTAERMTDMTDRAVGTAGDYASVMLPDGTTLRIPPAGSEEKLLAAATSGTPVSADDWVEFDRLTFEPDSARLTADSRAELSAIAAILNAYPAVRIKIGGYTDNSGDPMANLRLSGERATSVMSELIGMGIAPERLDAEGYGDKNPIATNDTEDGRAQNRRVAFCVTAH